MKYSFEHGERSRRGKKKAAVVNKKTLRRLVGFVLVLVTLLAAFQTGVLAATGDTSASTVEVAAQSEGDASGAQDVQPVSYTHLPVPHHGSEADDVRGI